VISPSQIPLPDNKQHLQQTNIHAPGRIRTHDLSRRAAENYALDRAATGIGISSVYTAVKFASDLMRIRQVVHRLLRIKGTKPNLLNIASFEPSKKLSKFVEQLRKWRRGWTQIYHRAYTFSNRSINTTNLSFQPVRAGMVQVAGSNNIRVLGSERGKHGACCRLA
jgi:hypothetical protein